MKEFRIIRYTEDVQKHFGCKTPPQPWMHFGIQYTLTDKELEPFQKGISKFKNGDTMYTIPNVNTDTAFFKKFALPTKAKYAIWIWDTRQVLEVGDTTAKLFEDMAPYHNALDNGEPLKGNDAKEFLLPSMVPGEWIAGAVSGGTSSWNTKPVDLIAGSFGECYKYIDNPKKHGNPILIPWWNKKEKPGLLLKSSLTTAYCIDNLYDYACIGPMVLVQIAAAKTFTDMLAYLIEHSDFIVSDFKRQRREANDWNRMINR